MAGLVVLGALCEVAGAIPSSEDARYLPFPTAWQTSSSWLTYWSMSCADLADCTAFGGFAPPSEVGQSPAFEVESGGVWQVPTTSSLPGDGTLTQGNGSISCATNTSCVSVGTVHMDDVLQPIIGTETAGSWDWDTSVPEPLDASQAFLTGVWCNSSGCAAVGGFDVTGSRTAGSFVDLETSGTWSLETTLPAPIGAGTTYTLVPSGVSCTDLQNCVVVGTYQRGTSSAQIGFADAETNGVWPASTTIDPQGSDFVLLSSVSCAPAVCMAAGGAAVAPGSTLKPLAVDYVSHSWQDPMILPYAFVSPPTWGGRVLSVACSSSNTCVAVGDLLREGVAQGITDRDDLAVAYTWSRGAWSAPGTADPAATSRYLGTQYTAVGCPPNSPTCVGLGDDELQNGQLTPTAQLLAPFEPVRMPSAPHVTQQIRHGNLVRVSWLAPRSGGGTPIASYQIALVVPGRPRRTVMTLADTCVIGNLVAHRSYVIIVRARNAAGRLGAETVLRGRT